MLAVLLRYTHRLAELLDLGAAQPAVAWRTGEATDTLCRVARDFPQPHCVLKNGVQGRHGACSDPFAACGGTAAATDARFGRLTGRDIGLGTFNVAQLKRVYDPFAQQRLDMRINSAAIHGKRRRLDRPASLAKNSSGLRLSHIPVADRTDG